MEELFRKHNQIRHKFRLFGGLSLIFGITVLLCSIKQESV